MGINGGGLIHTTIPPISRVQELHSTSQVNNCIIL